MDGEVYHLQKYVYGVRKSKSLSRPCVSVLKFRMRVCSSLNLSVLLEKSPFNVAHSRSEIEWSGIYIHIHTIIYRTSLLYS